MSTARDLQKHAESDSRLGEMMLYVAHKCSTDGNFGATKLNKILFFTDFTSFLTTGRSVTGTVYMRKENGPVPKRLLPVREGLIHSQRAAVQKRECWDGFVQHRLLALDEANLAGFSGEEIARVDRIVDAFKAWNAREVSDLSHELPAWQIAEDGEEIPYEAAFLLRPEDDPLGEEKARELAGC